MVVMIIRIMSGLCFIFCSYFSGKAGSIEASSFVGGWLYFFSIITGLFGTGIVIANIAISNFKED